MFLSRASLKPRSSYLYFPIAGIIGLLVEMEVSITIFLGWL
jgi:hypothetical protein